MLSAAMILASAFISGILLSPYISLTTQVLLTCIMLVGYTVFILISKKRNIIVYAAIIAMLLSGVRVYFSGSNRLYYEFPDKYITVTGTIDSFPSKTYGTYKYRYTLRADTAEYLGKKYAIDEKILLKTKNKLEYGQYISASGFLTEIDGPKNELAYDYSQYYGSIGISNRITALEINELGKTSKISPSFMSGKIKSELKDKITSLHSEEDAALLCTILLGDKSEFDRDRKTELMKTGLLHVLYSPFIHISIIIAAAGFLSRKKRDLHDFITVMLCLIYALYNSGAPGILKASFFTVLIIFSKKIYGFSDKTEVLSFIVLVMTAIEPDLCFNSGFMMSVISSVLVITCREHVFKFLAPIFQKLHIRSVRIKRILSLWFTLFIGTLPFCAYYFNGISVYAFLLAPPLILLITMLLASGILLAILPVSMLAPIVFLQKICLIPINYLPGIISKLPFYYIMLKTPNILEIISFYLFWIMILRGIKKRDITQKKLAAVLAAFIVCIISENSINTLDIYFVNVGQGDGAVMHTSSGETILIDGGGSAEYNSDYNIGEEIFLPYLISHGFTDIDVAVLSHFHIDHAEGIIAAAENLKINTLVVPPAMADNDYRLELEKIAQNRNIKIEYLQDGDKIKFRSGLTMDILAPDESQLNARDENDTSIVLSVNYGKFSALFTGDSSTPINDDYPEDIELLKVAHHGSNTSSSDEFLARTSPKYAVISVGENNSYNLPHPDALERLENSGAEILRTDKLGDIHFKIRKNGSMLYRTFIGG